VASYEGQNYLVTNWHVAAGRNPLTGQPMASTGAVPDALVVVQNKAAQLGRWEPRTEPLYEGNGDPLWLEHPEHGRRVDVVALPLTQTDGVDLFPYEPANPGCLIAIGPTAQVSIIGFPFGMTAGRAFGVWVQGTVASEPEVDFQNLPASWSIAAPDPDSPGRPSSCTARAHGAMKAAR
jgi:hypothetical protein